MNFAALISTPSLIVQIEKINKTIFRNQLLAVRAARKHHAKSKP